MNLISYLLSFILPQTIEQVSSKINGIINAEVSSGSYRITVNKYWQSGKYPKYILGKALKLNKNNQANIKNVLVLGLGGGSIIDEINKFYPTAKIIGVDLDPVMVYLGKKYLNLDKAINLKIVIDDASNFVRKIKSNQKFDMIVSDIFIGCDIPESTITNNYLNDIYSILADEGVYICNLPYRDEYKLKTDMLVKRVKKHFQYVETKNISPHLLIWAYKQ